MSYPWGVNDKINDLIWKSKIPLKVKVFLWQVFHKKLQTALALSRRGWHGSPLFSVCNLVETVDHILFGCVFSQYIWCCIRDAFNLQSFQTSVNELLAQWLTRRLGVPKRILFVFFAGLAWSIWRNRNKMAIEKRFPINPDAVIHDAINSLNMWCSLHKESDAAKLKELAQGLSDWMHKKPHFTGPLLGHCYSLVPRVSVRCSIFFSFCSAVELL